MAPATRPVRRSTRPRAAADFWRAECAQVSDLEGVSAAELAEELGIERDQAARLIAEVRCGDDSGMPLWPDARNALQHDVPLAQLLQREALPF